jgi:hypothetical protein
VSTSSGRCGDFQTVDDFSRTKPGNAATDNLYDDAPVPASQIGE